MSLNDAAARLLPQIEADLRDVLRTPHTDLAAYYGMLYYHLGWVDERLQPVAARGGKRVRPLLCLLACEAAGGDSTQALPASSGVELIHGFSLIHDDIEDGSTTRRGRPAVWSVWGVPQAVNAGDGLFVLARMAVHRLADRGVPARRRQTAVLAFDQACLALCEGQFFDMTFEDRPDVDLDQYLWMIRHKTAALLAASAQIGAVVATDDTELIRSAYCFGENLGMAFQIQDDVLGVWGDEQQTGKPASTDIRDRKKTLPIVYALGQQADLEAARAMAALYGRAGRLDGADIQAAIQILDHVGARKHAEEMAAEYYRVAIESLERMGSEGAPRVALEELAAALLERQS